MLINREARQCACHIKAGQGRRGERNVIRLISHLANQGVINDIISLAQSMKSKQRQQAGIARTGADQPHATGLERRHLGKNRIGVTHAAILHARPGGGELNCGHGQRILSRF